MRRRWSKRLRHLTPGELAVTTTLKGSRIKPFSEAFDNRICKKCGAHVVEACVISLDGRNSHLIQFEYDYETEHKCEGSTW